MQVYFNDLTLAPAADNSAASKDSVFLKDFLALKKEFFDELKAKGKECGKLVIANEKGLGRLIAAFECQPELKPFLWSCFGRGFQEDVEKDADHLLETQYTMEGPGQQKIQCDMLGLAHNERSFTLGINSSKFWQDLVYTIEKETLDGSIEVDALCLTHKSQISSEAVRNQIKISDGGYKVVAVNAVNPSFGKRIVVLGVHDRGVLIDVLRGMKIDPQRFDFFETGDVANYGITRWRNRDRFAAIMVGPVPHSAADMGDASSVLDALRDQPGYPHVETLTETMEEKIDTATGIKFYVPAGKLNITKNSFRCGLMNLMNLGLI